jgi:hypothetical protein
MAMLPGLRLTTHRYGHPFPRQFRQRGVWVYNRVAVRFLCSEEATAINGAAIPVCGPA